MCVLWTGPLGCLSPFSDIKVKMKAICYIAKWWLHFTLRKTKKKIGGPWRGLHEVYCYLIAWMKWSKINIQQHFC